MEKQQAIATWVNFMLLDIKKHCRLTHSEFLVLNEKYNIIDFLVENYDLLHYYDNDYIVDDTIRYVRESGGQPHELFRAG
jgi:hypothetical protein